MSNANETIADILREMRDRAITKIGGRTITERNFVPQETVEDWADRIEAAAERERAPGNAAAMREALEVVIQLVDDGMIQPRSKGDDDEHCFVAAIDMARAALAAPPLSAVGNVAKLREALEEIRVAAMGDYEPDADYLIDTCNAALSAPARNCDILSEEAANKSWDDYRHAHVLPRGGWDFRHIIAWLYAKAEGGAE